MWDVDVLLKLNYLLFTLEEPRVRFDHAGSSRKCHHGLLLSPKRRQAAAPSASEIKDIVIRAHVHSYQKRGDPQFIIHTLSM